MHPAYSVIFFTTASGAGYGLMALAALTGISHGEASSMAFGLTVMLTGLVLVSAGLLSSTLHLGRPERAWRAFSQWRSSWLSREGVAAVVTFLPALAFTAVWSGIIPLPELIKPIAIALLIMCAVTVITTGMIYASLKTIRQWNHWLTVPVYLAMALATGAVLLNAIAAPFGRGQVFLSGTAAVLIALAMLLKALAWRAHARMAPRLTPGDATGLSRIGKSVRQWEVPHTSANYIMKEMGHAIARKHAAKLHRLVMAGFGLALAAALITGLGGPLAPLLAIAAVIPAGVAVMTERWLFFAEAQHVVTLYYGAEAA